MYDTLIQRLSKRVDQGLKRELSQTDHLIDLTSNDYLGFARSVEPLAQCPPGSTGSRLLTGNSPFCEALEISIARFHRAETALIYNTGYMANLGLLAALGTADTTFLYDLDVHASLYDGMKLSDAKCFPFRHNDLASLEKRLQTVKAPVFVLIEAIYSISGDSAPLESIASLSLKYGAHLIVDEAHATGIRGEKGEGLTVELGLENQVFARIHTFSKALGAHGAAVVGPAYLKDYLINFSRPFIYTTALPPSSLATIAHAYEQLEKKAAMHRQRLDGLIDYFRLTGKTKEIALSPNCGPIQPLYLSSASDVKEKSKALRKEGLNVRAIVPPTTARGKECLRVVLHSFNREEEIAKLWSIL